MTAQELRQALILVDQIADERRWPSLINTAIDAARTIALPILEADPELVERLAKRMQEVAKRHVPREAALAAARDVLADVLAALITTDSEEA